MAFKVGRERNAVWTEPMPEDKDIKFKIMPLTPVLNEHINSSFIKASLVQEDGRNRLQTDIRSFGMSREQAKTIVVEWEGIVGDETMGPLAGLPLPCNDKNKALVFDVWDDGSELSAFVMKQAQKYNELREDEIKNSDAPSATS